MKKSKFTVEQIAFALHQADTGTSVEEVCRKIGISQATFYAWKKKFGGMGVSELRRLRQLEEENRKLKQIVADLSLDKAMLQAVAALGLIVFYRMPVGLRGFPTELLCLPLLLVIAFRLGRRVGRGLQFYGRIRVLALRRRSRLQDLALLLFLLLLLHLRCVA